MKMKIKPHKKGDGGYLCLPLVRNVPEPKNQSWRKVKCKLCGSACWESDGHREAMANEPKLNACCTMCALKAGLHD